MRTLIATLGALLLPLATSATECIGPFIHVTDTHDTTYAIHARTGKVTGRLPFFAGLDYPGAIVGERDGRFRGFPEDYADACRSASQALRGLVMARR